MNKKEKLQNQIEEFERSEKTPLDYMNLFSCVISVTRQGSGLVWSDIKDCVQDAILNAGFEKM